MVDCDIDSSHYSRSIKSIKNKDKLNIDSG
jgi:hypothetical protein